jgi:hypothetical protein
MPRGRLTKIDMETKIYNIFNQLEKDHAPQEYKGYAKEYLWKVMSAVKEYAN